MDNPSDIFSLCRLCLVKDQVNISIFDEQGDIRQIFLKISSCLPIKVSRDDKLPKKICDDCSNKLDLLYEFWNSSANAEKTLLSWLGQAGVKDAGGTINAVAQQIAKPTETLVKLESGVVEGNSVLISPCVNNVDNESFNELPKEESEAAPPPPKRTRRSAAVKAQINIIPESEDDDDIDTTDLPTKLEDGPEDSDAEDKDPSYTEVPGTSANDQPGPSGVGKAGGVEAPHLAEIAEITIKKEPMSDYCTDCGKQYESYPHHCEDAGSDGQESVATVINNEEQELLLDEEVPDLPVSSFDASLEKTIKQEIKTEIKTELYEFENNVSGFEFDSTVPTDSEQHENVKSFSDIKEEVTENTDSIENTESLEKSTDFVENPFKCLICNTDLTCRTSLYLHQIDFHTVNTNEDSEDESDGSDDEAILNSLEKDAKLPDKSSTQNLSDNADIAEKNSILNATTVTNDTENIVQQESIEDIENFLKSTELSTTKSSVPMNSSITVPKLPSKEISKKLKSTDETEISVNKSAATCSSKVIPDENSVAKIPIVPNLIDKTEKPATKSVSISSYTIPKLPRKEISKDLINSTEKATPANANPDESVADISKNPKLNGKPGNVSSKFPLQRDPRISRRPIQPPKKRISFEQYKKNRPHRPPVERQQLLSRRFEDSNSAVYQSYQRILYPQMVPSTVISPPPVLTSQAMQVINEVTQRLTALQQTTQQTSRIAEEDQDFEHEPTFCEFCGIPQTNLNRHMKNSHGGNKFKCFACDASFHNIGLFLKHISEHPSSVIMEAERLYLRQRKSNIHPYFCFLCGAGFTLTQILKDHLKNHPPIVQSLPKSTTSAHQSVIEESESEESTPHVDISDPIKIFNHTQEDAANSGSIDAIFTRSDGKIPAFDSKQTNEDEDRRAPLSPGEDMSISSADEEFSTAQPKKTVVSPNKDTYRDLEDTLEDAIGQLQAILDEEETPLEKPASQIDEEQIDKDKSIPKEEKPELSMSDKKKSFNCQYCAKKFSFFYHLKRHLMSQMCKEYNLYKKKHICINCNLKFKSNDALQKHLKTTCNLHRKIPENEPPIIKKINPAALSIKLEKNHTKTDDKINKTIIPNDHCEFCNTDFPFGTNMAAHRANFCSKFNITKVETQPEIVEIKNNPEIMVIEEDPPVIVIKTEPGDDSDYESRNAHNCTSCGMYQKSKEDLKLHKVLYCKDVCKKARVACDACLKAFENDKQLKKHRLKYCEELLNRKSEKKKERKKSKKDKRESRKKKNFYSCKNCGERFEHSFSLVRHEYIECTGKSVVESPTKSSPPPSTPPSATSVFNPAAVKTSPNKNLPIINKKGFFTTPVADAPGTSIKIPPLVATYNCSFCNMSFKKKNDLTFHEDIMSARPQEDHAALARKVKESEESKFDPRKPVKRSHSLIEAQSSQSFNSSAYTDEERPNWNAPKRFRNDYNHPSSSSSASSCPIKPSVQNFANEARKQILRDHIISIYCETCGEAIRNVEDLKDLKCGHDFSTFKCLICELDFSDVNSLLSHLNEMHEQSELSLKEMEHADERYYCCYCGQYFNFINYLKEHIIASHECKLKTPIRPSTQWFLCKFCPKMIFTSKNSLQVHETKSKVHKDNVKLRRLLKQDDLSVNLNENFVHVCRICNLAFITFREQQIHMLESSQHHNLVREALEEENEPRPQRYQQSSNSYQRNYEADAPSHSFEFESPEMRFSGRRFQKNEFPSNYHQNGNFDGRFSSNESSDELFEVQCFICKEYFPSLRQKELHLCRGPY